jgi:HK97 gp10 family phage protein
MASFKVEGLAELIEGFGDISSIPDHVIDEMLNAEADVAVKAQKKSAETMLRGPYAHNPVQLAGAIKKARVKATSDGKSISIYFAGSRKRGKSEATNAEIAFVNEFGKRGQPARPFIKKANEECADDAVKAATEVHNAFLKSKNL